MPPCREHVEALPNAVLVVAVVLAVIVAAVAPTLGHAWLSLDDPAESAPVGISPGQAYVAPTTGAAGLAGAVPMVSSPSVDWFNETKNMDLSGGPAVYGAGLAYDPLLEEMVLFGGLSPSGSACTSGCLSDATWLWGGALWSNATAYFSGVADGLPPPMEGMMMAWDPQWGGVLLVGGALSNSAAGNSVSNQTWLLNSSGWFNLTSNVNNRANGTSASPDDAFGSMAYDGAIHEMVVTDGCSDFSSGACATLLPETYALGGPGSTWRNVGVSEFSAGHEFPGTSQGGSAASMAYDPTGQELVYFGGEDAASGVQNYTWLMNATGWYNVTGDSHGCVAAGGCSSTYYPAGTAYGGMSWDGQLGEIVLVGGRNTSASETNQTSVFSDGAWYPLCASPCAVTMPTAGARIAMASNSSDVAPLLVEGLCTTFPRCLGNDWVLEVPPQPHVAISSNPGEVGLPERVTGTNVVGTGSGPVVSESLFDNSTHASSSTSTDVNFTTAYSFSATFTYRSPGSYRVSASSLDFFDVIGTSSTTLTVNASLAVSSGESTNATETGSSVSFTVTASLGVPPYAYLWDFGDQSPNSTVADPFHTWTRAGNYTVTVVVTDSVGGRVAEQLAIAITARTPLLPLVQLLTPRGELGLLAFGVVVASGAGISLAVLRSYRRGPR